MAHQLNFNESAGTWSFASRKEVAWHGLGQIVENAMTSEEAIRLANLDYEVQKVEVFTNFNGEMKPVQNQFATIRIDNGDYLGMVKSRYEIVQNREAFSFFDAIIDADEAVFETAGALGRGEKIWLLAKLPEDLLIGDEKVEKYILLTNSHDGSSSLIAGLTQVRVVCNNTLQAALRGLDNKIAIEHVAGAKDRLKEASRVMGIASSYGKEVQAIFNQMVDYRMGEGEYKDYITQIMTPEYKNVPIDKEEEKAISTRLKNIVDSTLEFALTHPTQTTPSAYQNLWGAYNSISGYFQYIKKYDSQMDNFRSQFFGSANQKMLKAFNQANVMLTK